MKLLTKNSTIDTGITLSLLLLLTACDCYRHVHGTVLEKETGRPLQGITVYHKNKEWNKTLTDSTGRFELSDVSGGFRCAPMNIVIKAHGYKNFEMSIPSGGQDTIKLVK